MKCAQKLLICHNKTRPFLCHNFSIHPVYLKNRKYATRNDSWKYFWQFKKGYESVKENNPAAMNLSPHICTWQMPLPISIHYYVNRIMPMSMRLWRNVPISQHLLIKQKGTKWKKPKGEFCINPPCGHLDFEGLSSKMQIISLFLTIFLEQNTMQRNQKRRVGGADIMQLWRVCTMHMVCLYLKKKIGRSK